MTFFTRNRGSKRLRARRANGRFKRATLEDVTGLTACRCCGRFFEVVTFDESGPFVERKRVKKCPHCGASVNPEPEPESS